MPKLSITVVAAVVLSAAAPASAQEQPPAAQAAPDPARLAAAATTINYVLPAGTYAKMMMGGTLSKMMDQVTDSMTAMPLTQLVAAAGLPQEDVAKLGKATLADLMEIMDPAYKQRQKATIDAMIPVLNDMMATLEPGIREGLTNAYAKRFTLGQLQDINRFFATPSGTAYANNAMLLFMDPEVIDRETKDMPKMMQNFVAQLPAIEEKVKAATADLPKPREYKDLTPAQKSRLASLLGVDEKDLDKASASSARTGASVRSSRH